MPFSREIFQLYDKSRNPLSLIAVLFFKRLVTHKQLFLSANTQSSQAYIVMSFVVKTDPGDLIRSWLVVFTYFNPNFQSYSDVNCCFLSI